MDDYEEVIQEKVSEVESVMRDVYTNLEDSDSCSVCGVSEYEMKTVIGTAKIRTHLVECHGCNTETWVDEIIVKNSEESIPSEKRAYFPDSCPNCSRSERGTDFLEYGTLEREIEQQRFMESVVSTKLANHHTDYKENETIIVCASCHAKIHHKSEFRPDLEPFMSREEARRLGYQ